MGFCGMFSSVEEYDAEIDYIKEQIRKAAGAEKWRLNTSQSDQQVTMNMSELRAYLKQLATERQALYERLAGAGVTSITPRRFF